MKQDAPFVSIVIPVYNAQRTIGACLESVTQLDYPKDKMEVIVVDNGSTDKSREIIRSFPVTMLEEREIQSAYAARNRGIRESRGEWIVFTDADCIVDPGWLSHLVLHHDDNTIGCVTGEIFSHKPTSFIEEYSARVHIFTHRSRFFSKKSYVPRPFAAGANAAYRKEVFKRIGLYANTISGGDIEMSWRMQKQLGLRVLFEPRAILYHKQYASITDLYKQSYRHESGHIFINKIHPDFPLKDIMNGFERAMNHALRLFPAQLGKFIKREIDGVELMMPFLDALRLYARYRARKKYAPDLIHGT